MINLRDDRRQPTCHPTLRELVKSVEVEVVVPLVPALGFIFLASGEAEQLGRVDVEDVEAVGTAVNLEEPLALVLNPRNAIFNLHLGASFVELAETHDHVSECRDEVHAIKYPVLTVLHLEDDGADA